MDKLLRTIAMQSTFMHVIIVVYFFNENEKFDKSFITRRFSIKEGKDLLC